MKIQFCDLCNESVPQSDLEQGRAFLRKGRVICKMCDGVMSGASATITSDSDTKIGAAGRTALPPESASAATLGGGSEAGGSPRNRGPVQYRAEGGGGLLAGFLSAVAVVLVGVVAVMLKDRVDSVAMNLDGDVAAVQRDVAAAEADLAGRIDSMNLASLRSAERFDARLDEILATRASADLEAAKRMDGVINRLDDLADRLSSLAPTERAVADHARSLVAVEAGLKGLRSEVTQLASDLAARPVIVAQPIIEEPVGPSWLALVEDLENANSGVRWNTVEDLGRTADPAVVPYLLPVLQDQDNFVRMAVARILGKLGDLSAVGPLIDSLGDSAESVRDAAVFSLRTLTNENFRYDARAKQADRTKRARAWRDWWEKQNKA